MRRRPRLGRASELPLARQVLLLQVGLVLLLVVGASTLATYDARRDVRTSATDRALAVARAVADSPTIDEALATPDPSATIQPFAEQVRTDTGVDFVTVMSPERIRYSHPDPANIGKRFVGDVGDAPQGRAFTQQYTGTLGPSMRAVVPVREGGDGPVVALVSVGITVQAIDRQLRRDLTIIAIAALLVLGVGLLGSWLVGRRLRRQTHGLGARELTRMYEYYTAVLGAVREGLLLLDTSGRVQLANDEARRLLDLPDDVVGRRLDGLGLAPGLVSAALNRTAESDDLYLAGDRVLVVSSSPATWKGADVGAVVTLRDHTELRAVTGELDAVRGLSDSLRAQSHESANRLHTVVSLIELGRVEEAVDFATEELQVAQLLTDRVVDAVGDPVVEALLLGKHADAAERGIELRIGGSLPPAGVPARDLVTVLGNLVDNAFDAVAEQPLGQRRVDVELGGSPGPNGSVVVTVGDSGCGLDDDALAHAFERGWSTKATGGGAGAGGRGLGLALVAQTARRRDGSVGTGRSPLGGASFEVVLR
ncbi:sensor histidine kinase [Nocardioides flavescens]|uniref:histidine kinase n=1 Tax=Nocardioides flavescens TaxID=2691959 RepID=A0A6L7F1E5_9ACTN|nr:sensor histidine kinase [Nocardioides flavescens]MXG90641.1 PAS domain-containing protein [Nocardioides flavescens]